MPELPELEKRTYKALRARELAYEREVQKALRDALNEIRVELTRIYDRYAQDGKLTLAQMTQYNRLSRLEEQIVGELDKATRSNLRTINRLRPDQYGESFFRYAWSVDQSTGLRLRWGQLNRLAVLESLNNREYRLAISTYTPDARVRILRALNNGLPQGKSYTRMSREIKDAINATYFQAQRIIRTEGQTAVNAAQDAAHTVAEEQGVNMDRQWNATLDSVTRDSHQQMDGRRKADDGLYHFPSGATAAYPADPGLPAKERIQCVPEGTIVLAESAEKIYKRWYSGALIDIVTAGGHEFSITPNHPILTDQGWVAADLLAEGSNIVCMGFDQQIDRPDKYIHYCPPVVDKIFDFFRVATIKKRVMGVDGQFHGDGSNGDVDIETLDSKLWDRFESALFKPCSKLRFTASNILSIILTCLRGVSKVRLGTFRAAYSLMGSHCQAFTFLRSCLRHSHKHSFRSISRRNAVQFQQSAYRPSANAKGFGDRFLGFPVEITADNIIRIRKRNWSGHVYNLQTVSGWYGVYNGKGKIAIVHNCRCAETAVIEGYEPALRRSREEGIIPYQTYEDWEASRGKPRWKK